MMVGRRFAPYSLYFVVRIDLSTLKAHPKTAQSKHDLCVGLLYSKHIEGEDHVPNSAYNQHSYKNCMFISIRERKLVDRQLSFSSTIQKSISKYMRIAVDYRGHMIRPAIAELFEVLQILHLCT